MLARNSVHLILDFVGIILSSNQALATSCQVYPSEYAYRYDSVNRAESASANCRRYPEHHQSQSIHPEDYIHCDGTQLKLTDSNLGQEQYGGSECYWWSTGMDGQLLFLFPTIVSLTTITLHYYNDSQRGLPRLRFYAVPDDFDVWDAATTSYPHVDITAVPSGGEPADRRNISTNVNFNTKKVLMYKFSSTFQFALSEVKFFKREVPTCANSTSAMAENSVSGLAESASTTGNMLTESTTTVENPATTNSLTTTTSTTSGFTTDIRLLIGQPNSITKITAIGVSIALLLILLSTILIITVVVLIWSYKRRYAKKEFYSDNSYSVLSRGSGQSQSIQHDSAQLYDQIHLSPSTGQTEFTLKPQSENINNPPYNLHPTHPDTKNSGTHASAASQANSPPPTYASINKSKKKKVKKGDIKHTAPEKKGPPVPPYTQKVSSSSTDKGVDAGRKDDPTMSSQKYPDDMHASDHKDQEKMNNEQESNPSHRVEELYTAVKKPKGSSVPVKEPTSQAVEDLYTTVMKKPEESSMKNKAVPPIPPHTVEELYTAVQKKPKGSAVEDEEEAPPIHPYTAEDTS